MITLEALRKVDHILTHKDCADGISSAMILKDVIPGAKVTFLQPNSPEQRALVAEPGQLFCDFIPDPARVQAFVDVGAIVLDHHKYARETVEAFGDNAVFADEATEPGVCGAVLAYRHVWLPLNANNLTAMSLGGLLPVDPAVRFVEDLATLAGIRDTWQKKDPRWHAACGQAEALKFWPLERLLGTSPTTWKGLIQPVGNVLYENTLSYAVHLAETSYRFVTDRGTRVVIFGGAGMSSDTAEAVGDTADIVIGFGYKCEEGKPFVIFSTRSHTTYDVGAFCKAHGGGGHTKSAGFSQQLDLTSTLNPIEQFRLILETYEKANA